MEKFEIILYEKEDGTKPVRDFINGVDKKMKSKITHTINLLAENGIKLREPYSKHLEDGIFELRVKVATDISRVLYFFVVGKNIVLTNGFIKKTQQTPKGEIELAKEYRADYIKREEQEKNDRRKI